MLSNDTCEQYKQDLKRLVQSWSVARVSKKSKDLTSFRNTVSEVAQSYASFPLFTLHEMLQSMQSTCERGMSGQYSSVRTKADIDWLMNQLIRSNKLTPDPILSESDENEELLLDRKTQPAYGPQSIVKVAIIDDEKSVGGLLKAMLEQFSFDVSYFESTADFEISLQQTQPDLVLLDITMPAISTEQVFDFAQQLVQRNIKVITCSSLFNFETRLHAVRAGVSDYAVKPVNVYSLVEKITRSLKRQVNQNYQIVMLDDQVSMGEFYQAVFSHVNVDFHFFQQAEELLDAIEHLQPDLFLLDRIMPSVNGLEVASMIRQDPKFDFSPIVFLTADEQLDTKLNILAHGADDLIAKNTPTPLVLKQVMARLERSAFIKSFVSKDPLTGVLNHGQIVEAANHQLRLHKRHPTPCVLALIDVDHFKDVNDSHGHSAGDLVLNGLGQLLQSSVRETDLVGRYGGEEFVILFVDCELAQAHKKLDAIRERCTKMHFVQHKPSIAISFSGGLVDLSEHKELPPAISEADRLLYLAKESGRNQIKI
ncbi:diguanylate cyclase [Ningiella sp. W23]|uniref:GGDEF domain-containing response regulator n=1 Tax=Ningiella sp. W23 TaxID=3023715 RepID=UPI0037570A69